MLVVRLGAALGVDGGPGCWRRVTTSPPARAAVTDCAGPAGGAQQPAPPAGPSGHSCPVELETKVREDFTIMEKAILLDVSAYVLVLSHLRHYAELVLTHCKYM